MDAALTAFGACTAAVNVRSIPVGPVRAVRPESGSHDVCVATGGTTDGVITVEATIVASSGRAGMLYPALVWIAFPAGAESAVIPAWIRHGRDAVVVNAKLVPSRFSSTSAVALVTACTRYVLALEPRPPAPPICPSTSTSPTCTPTLPSGLLTPVKFAPAEVNACVAAAAAVVTDPSMPLAYA